MRRVFILWLSARPSVRPATRTLLPTTESTARTIVASTTIHTYIHTYIYVCIHIYVYTQRNIHVGRSSVYVAEIDVSRVYWAELDQPVCALTSMEDKSYNREERAL